ncbi:hypothetical protein XELAEV_18033210mg [Xenopus laevis]|uniref:Uncharacterized protein n=1 Tax=Xenopus laevis TaxID=8355 RepID=A0A974HDT8_XENLA|nr:hypothetical protein XELAEV_18033210mg [Xenopus laevis]
MYKGLLLCVLLVICANVLAQRDPPRAADANERDVRGIKEFVHSLGKFGKAFVGGILNQKRDAEAEGGRG